MLLFLHPHPAAPSEHAHRIAVTAVRSRDRLQLRYRLEGAIDRLAIPAPVRLARADRLWEHSCFEAFVRPTRDSGYFEFNFAPSLAWAAYEFEAERSGMRDADLGAPRLSTWSDANCLELEAEVSGIPLDEGWRVGLCAIIEERSGRRSYWALSHHSEQPDFHRPQSFSLSLV